MSAKRLRIISNAQLPAEAAELACLPGERALLLQVACNPRLNNLLFLSKDRPCFGQEEAFRIAVKKRNYEPLDYGGVIKVALRDAQRDGSELERKIALFTKQRNRYLREKPTEANLDRRHQTAARLFREFRVLVRQQSAWRRIRAGDTLSTYDGFNKRIDNRRFRYHIDAVESIGFPLTAELQPLCLVHLEKKFDAPKI